MADKTETPVSQLPALRQEAQTRALALKELRSIPAEKRDADWTLKATEEIRTVNMLDAEIKMTERAEYAAPVVEGRGPKGATAPAANERRSLGDVVTERFGARQERGGLFEVRVDGNAREMRTLLDYADSGSTDAKQFVPVGSPFLSTPAIDRRRLFVQDFMPSTDTDLATVPYIREHLPRTSEEGAEMVAEGTAKPEVDMLFERADAPIRKVAAYVPVTDEIVEDAPTLRGYIDARLGYMVDLRIEEQLLSGDGTGVQLLGVMHQPDVQTQACVNLAAGAGHPDIPTTIAKAISKIDLVDGDANGTAMNPSDFWSMVTLRAATDGHYDQGSPYGNQAAMTPWGLNTVRTRSLPAGTAVVGSWQIGAQIFNRSGLTVKVGMINDDFIKNRQVILAERRLGLAVHRPDFFVVTTVTS